MYGTTNIIHLHIVCTQKGDFFVFLISYLAETPFACKEKVRELLDYMLSVEGEDEQRFNNF